MDNKYSTIQQHQPLRIPEGWEKQEKAFVVQLEEIFDDLYRRFGRLGMNDMSKGFRITINGKYDKVSGITIDEDGVEISGNKSVDIKAGDTWWQYGDKGVRVYKEYSPGSSSYEILGFIGELATGRVFPYTGIEFDSYGLNIYNNHFASLYGPHPYVAIGQHPVSTSNFSIYCTDSHDSAIGAPSSLWKYGYFDTVYYYNLTQISSREVKHSIFDMKPVGDVLDKLKPVTFIYNGDATERVHSGLIYEDTVQVLPGICMNAGQQKSINYMELVPMLLKEVQDLRRRVAELEAKSA